MSSRATLLLPLPDSPTSPKVVPRAMEKLTPSTACTDWRGLRSTIRSSQGADTSNVLVNPMASTRAVMQPSSARQATNRLHALPCPAAVPAAQPGNDQTLLGNAD